MTSINPIQIVPSDAFDNCAICIQSNLEFPNGNTENAKIIGKLDCNHFFHFFCLQQLLNSNTGHKCPTCRKEFSAENITQHNVDQNIQVLQGKFKRVIIFKGDSTALIIDRK